MRAELTTPTLLPARNQPLRVVVEQGCRIIVSSRLPLRFLRGSEGTPDSKRLINPAEFLRQAWPQAS